MNALPRPDERAARLEEIADGIRTLAGDGPVELRRFARGGGGLGRFFADPEAAAAWALDQDRHAAGVYLTANKLDPVAVAMKPRGDLASGLTSTEDVLRHTAFLVDCDAVRREAGEVVAGNRSDATDQEREAALALGEQVAALLRRADWPEPVTVWTPNGAQRWYAMDLPNDEGSGRLKAEALAGLAFLFDTDDAKVDTGVWTAARVARLPGTTSRKGPGHPERPHRRASLVAVPWGPGRGMVTREQLAALAAMAPPSDAEAIPKASSAAPDYQGPAFGVEAKLAEWGYEVERTAGYKGGRKYVPDRCQSCGNTDRSLVVVRFPGGLWARCQHASCGIKSWPDLREFHEPGYRDRRHGLHVAQDEPNHEDGAPEGGPALDEPAWLREDGRRTLADDVRREYQRQRIEVSPVTFQNIASPDVLKTPWLVEGLIPAAGLTLVAAHFKTGKTFLTYRVVLDALEGRAALGVFAVPRPLRVQLWQFEMPEDINLRRFHKLAKGIGMDPADVYRAEQEGRFQAFVQPGLELTDPRGLAVFHAKVEAFNPDLLVLDSIGEAFAGSSTDTNNASDVRRMLRNALGRLTKAGRATLALHHKRKTLQNGKEDDARAAILGSQAFGAAARCLWTLDRVASDTDEPGRFVVRLASAGGWDLESGDHVFAVADTPDGTATTVEPVKYGGKSVVLTDAELAAVRFAELLRKRFRVGRQDAIETVRKDLGCGETVAKNGLELAQERDWVVMVKVEGGKNNQKELRAGDATDWEDLV